VVQGDVGVGAGALDSLEDAEREQAGARRGASAPRAVGFD
jgi:hypothetical protein